MKQTDLEEAVAYAARKVAWRIDPEDIAQETLEALLTGGYDLDTVDRALVFTVAKRKAIDMVRKLRDVPVGYQDSGANSQGAAILRTNPSLEPAPDHALLEDELDKALDGYALSVLCKLDVPKQRLVARAYYLDGMDSNEMAELLGWKADLTRYHLKMARQTLGAQQDDLAIYRQHVHPDAKTPKGVPVATEGLRELMGQYTRR